MLKEQILKILRCTYVIKGLPILIYNTLADKKEHISLVIYLHLLPAIILTSIVAGNNPLPPHIRFYREKLHLHLCLYSK